MTTCLSEGGWYICADYYNQKISTMKRLLFSLAFIATCILSSATPIVVDGVAYAPVSDSTVAVTAIDGFTYYGKIVIPETIEHEDVRYTVVAIGDEAFYRCYCLTDISLPKSIREIGDFAFCDCRNLNSIVLPESLEQMGKKAFWQCQKLKKVVIPNNVEFVPEACFEECSSLSSVTLGKSVTTIRSRAFCKCTSLASIKIPANVESIKSSAFKDCGKLATVTFENKQKVKIDERSSFANTPYGNANSKNGIKNDPRFKIKKSVTF